MGTSRDKPITRRTMLSRRDVMPPDERAAASARIAERAVALAEALPMAAVVALYAPKGSEVDTAPLDAALRGRVRLAYPRVLDDTRELAFHLAAPAELAPARFGLNEPAATASRVALAEISVFFVPGLAFDRAGGRVGWGRGHYDATLAGVPGALRVGLAFECQLVAAVPHDPHDVRLHFVVTEHDTYRTSD